jgi:beta-lactamase class D
MINLSKLKTLAASFILLFAANTVFSQSAQTELEIIQEAFGLDKKVAVANFMELGDAAKSFWNIYKELGKMRLKIIADYAKSYPTISDEQILELFKRTEALKKSFGKLQKTYFNRMRKEVGTSKAAQFWQLENYFNAMIQAEIYAQIPFIGENLDEN